MQDVCFLQARATVCFLQHLACFLSLLTLELLTNIAFFNVYHDSISESKESDRVTTLTWFSVIFITPMMVSATAEPCQSPWVLICVRTVQTSLMRFRDNYFPTRYISLHYFEVQKKQG